MMSQYKNWFYISQSIISYIKLNDMADYIELFD